MQIHMPIGYKMIEGKIHFDENKTDVVKKIFLDYLSGKSSCVLARELKEMGISNANNNVSWSHGAILKMLENVKYIRDEMYPPIIETEIFEKVQQKRKEKRQKYGMTQQKYQTNKHHIFSEIITCGVCKKPYKRYICNCGKPCEDTYWQCQRYIKNNRVYCISEKITDEQISQAFISAANDVILNINILNTGIKEVTNNLSLEHKKHDEKISSLELQNNNYGKEMLTLIYKRAEAAYQTAPIKSLKYNTETIRQAFLNRNTLTKFDDELFKKVIRNIRMYENRKIIFEFINGFKIEKIY